MIEERILVTCDNCGEKQLSSAETLDGLLIEGWYLADDIDDDDLCPECAKVRRSHIEVIK